jgi:small conductance mechanosensitive channel
MNFISSLTKFQINWVQIVKSVLSILVIVVLTAIAYSIAKIAIHKVMNRNSKLGGNQKRIRSLQTLLTNIVGYILFFIAFVSILEQFGINTTGLIASAGVLGLAIGFGAKELVSDVVTGFFLLLEDQVHVEDYVTVNDYTGIVEATGLRVLRIRGLDGDLHFIPNREIKSLTNHSRGSANSIIDLYFPVTKKEEVLETLQAIQAKCDHLQEMLEEILEGPSVVFVETPHSSDHSIRILAKTKPDAQRKVTEELQRIVDESLENKQTQYVNS